MSGLLKDGELPPMKSPLFSFMFGLLKDGELPPPLAPLAPPYGFNMDGGGGDGDDGGGRLSSVLPVSAVSRSASPPESVSNATFA